MALLADYEIELQAYLEALRAYQVGLDAGDRGFLVPGIPISTVRERFSWLMPAGEIAEAIIDCDHRRQATTVEGPPSGKLSLSLAVPVGTAWASVHAVRDFWQIGISPDRLPGRREIGRGLSCRTGGVYRSRRPPR